MDTPRSQKEPRSLAEEIDKTFLNCGICLERFTDPRALPCLHAFCCGCLEKLTRGMGKTLFCPTCRKRTRIPAEGVRGYAAHFMVSYLKDTVDKHIESDQETALPLTTPTQKYCSSHDGELIRYYCETCKITICPDCVILDSEHKDHKYTRLKDIAKEQAASLKDLAKVGREFEEKYCKCIQDTEQVENDLDITAQLAYSRLNKIEWNFKNHLDLILTGYKDRLRKQELSRDVVITHTKDELNKNLSTLQKSCDLAMKVAEVGTEHDIFANYANLSTKLQDCMLIKPKSVDVELGNVTMGRVEESAAVAMVLVAHDYDSRHTKLSWRDRHSDVSFSDAKTFSKYLLVALFAILVYRIFCSLVQFV